MKQLFLFAGAMALAGGMLFTSCKDNTEEQPGTVPEVSISADETFASDYTATVTLTLSSASSSDVVVNLADADVESGQSEVPAVYSKSVTIGAGKTSATVKVSADVLGLTEGTYQSAIMIASAEGADVAENSVVYIGLDYVELPAVNLYADDHFTHTRTAELRLRLEEAAEANVTVTLEDDASSTVSVEYENDEIKRIDTIVVSTQHDAKATQEEIRELIMNEVIKPSINEKFLDENTKYFINPRTPNIFF